MIKMKTIFKIKKKRRRCTGSNGIISYTLKCQLGDYTRQICRLFCWRGRGYNIETFLWWKCGRAALKMWKKQKKDWDFWGVYMGIWCMKKMCAVFWSSVGMMWRLWKSVCWKINSFGILILKFRLLRGRKSTGWRWRKWCSCRKRKINWGDFLCLGWGKIEK